MASALPFQLLADMVLAVHFAIVTFVVGGLVFVVAGNILRCFSGLRLTLKSASESNLNLSQLAVPKGAFMLTNLGLLS